MAIKEEFKRHITGTKTPDKGRLAWKVIFILVAWIITLIASGYFGYYINEINKKPDIFLTFGALDKDLINYFFPVILINSGQKDLTNISLKIKTCYMDNYRQYSYTEMVPSQKELIKFRDDKTFEIMEKKKCGLDYNFSLSGCEIEVFILNETNLYVPPMNCSIYLCDFCEYKSFIKVDEIQETKEFSGRFFSPREIKLTITPQELVDVNISNLKPFSPVRINFFTTGEMCVWDGTCSISQLEPYSIEDFLPRLPVYVTLNPIEPYKSINVSVNYLNLSSILEFKK